MGKEKDFSVDIPTWNNITVEQYDKFVKFSGSDQAKEDGFYLITKGLQLFLGIEHEDVMKMPDNVAHFTYERLLDSIEALHDVIYKESKIIHRFNMLVDDKEVEFGAIPNLERMAFGEYIDLSNYTSSEKSDLQKMMAVMYRPISKKWKDTYEIEEYQGSDRYYEFMKDAPAAVALSARLFFYRLTKKLPIFTVAYLSKKEKQVIQTKLEQVTQENGDGIQAFTLWLRAHHLKLIEQLSSRSTQP